MSRFLTGALAALAAVSFGVASAVHAGLTAPLVRDSFPGAFVPEAVIGFVMAVGAVALLAGWRRSRAVAVAATCFALLGTGYGLTVTARRGPAGDIVYHVAVFLLLLAIVTLLLARRPPAPGRAPTS